MDERDGAEEQVEDLEIAGEDAEQVKGGAKGTQVAIESIELAHEGVVGPRSPRPGNLRGVDGAGGQHNETLVVI